MKKSNRPNRIYVVSRRVRNRDTDLLDEQPLSFHLTRGGAFQRINDEIWGDWCEEHGVPDGCPDPKDWRQVEPWRWENEKEDITLFIRPRCLEE